MGKRKPKHVGFWTQVDGEPVHMLADPDMSPETAEALAHVIRAARKMVEEDEQDLTGKVLCTRCNKNYTDKGVCGPCKIEMLWE